MHFIFPILQVSTTSQEKKSSSINKNTDEESGSGDQIPSAISQQWLEGTLMNISKSLCPTIA